MGRAASGPAAVLLAVAVLVSGCGSRPAPGEAGPVADLSYSDPDGMHGAVLPEPYDVPATVLRATDGTPYSLADADAELTLVFLGYTHCPDVCTLVMADVASALTRLRPAERRRVDMVFVTTDPARDDPRTIRAYLDRFDPSFEGLTGPLPRILAVGEALGVPIEKGERLPTGGYEVGHGAQVVGVLPDGTAPIVWTEGTQAAELAADIRVVLAGGGLA